MKFKYNYLTNQLWWKIDGSYSYEVSESQRFHTPHGTYGSDGFQLGAREWITFILTQQSLKVCYQKRANSYQKILPLPNAGEITFEFTNTDLIN